MAMASSSQVHLYQRSRRRNVFSFFEMQLAVEKTSTVIAQQQLQPFRCYPLQPSDTRIEEIIY
jgi:hypothetical protein